MRVKWNTSPRDCDGHLRETGVEYDDFTSHALETLLKDGRVSPVDEAARTLAASLAKPTTAPAPAPAAVSGKPVTDGEAKE